MNFRRHLYPDVSIYCGYYQIGEPTKTECLTGWASIIQYKQHFKNIKGFHYGYITELSSIKRAVKEAVTLLKMKCTITIYTSCHDYEKWFNENKEHIVLTMSHRVRCKYKYDQNIQNAIQMAHTEMLNRKRSRDDLLREDSEAVGSGEENA